MLLALGILLLAFWLFGLLIWHIGAIIWLALVAAIVVMGWHWIQHRRRASQ